MGRLWSLRASQTAPSTTLPVRCWVRSRSGRRTNVCQPVCRASDCLLPCFLASLLPCFLASLLVLYIAYSAVSPLCILYLQRARCQAQRCSHRSKMCIPAHTHQQGVCVSVCSAAPFNPPIAPSRTSWYDCPRTCVRPLHSASAYTTLLWSAIVNNTGRYDR